MEPTFADEKLDPPANTPNVHSLIRQQNCTNTFVVMSDLLMFVVVMNHHADLTTFCKFSDPQQLTTRTSFVVEPIFWSV